MSRMYEKVPAKVAIEVASVLGLLTCLKYRVEAANSEVSMRSAYLEWRTVVATALGQLAAKLAPGNGNNDLEKEHRCGG